MTSSDPPTITPATMNYDEAARYVGISRRSLERLVKSGAVRHLPVVAHRVLFRPKDLDAFLDSVARGGEPRRGRSPR